MFKEMRRNKQVLDNNEAIKVLQRNTSGTLALLSDHNYPYALPISYVYYEGKLFFHSSTTGHKIDAIRKNNKASFCVIDEDQVIPDKFTTHYRSVIAFGKISILEDDAQKQFAIHKFIEKYVPNDYDSKQVIEQTYDKFCIIELDIEHISGKESMAFVQERK